MEKGGFPSIFDSIIYLFLYFSIEFTMEWDVRASQQKIKPILPNTHSNLPNQPLYFRILLMEAATKLYKLS
jgi:hypothetical protein